MEGEMICIGSGYGQWLIWVLWSSGESAVISKHLPWASGDVRKV
jgi:hypothetical protein